MLNQSCFQEMQAFAEAPATGPDTRTAHQCAMGRIPGALRAVWAILRALFDLMSRTARVGDHAVAAFLCMQLDDLYQEFSDPAGLLYLRVKSYQHRVARHLADIMYELAPLSLVHCSSCGLEATNKFAHKIWGNIWANGGVQPSKRLIVFYQLLSLHLNVRRRMLYAELERSL